MHGALEIISACVLLLGTFFGLVGGIGLIRLPDLFSRMHGSGITDTLGAMLVLSGLILHSGFSLVTVKLVAVLFFLFVTSPTATHALARSALAQGVRPWARKEEPSSNT